jgi:hypothetical protein
MDKSKLLKAAPVVGVIVLSAAACALAGYIVARWPIMDASLKPAIVSGAFTILATRRNVLPGHLSRDEVVKGNGCSTALSKHDMVASERRNQELSPQQGVPSRPVG